MRSNVQRSRSPTEQVRAAHSQFGTALHPKKMETRIQLLAIIKPKTERQPLGNNGIQTTWYRAKLTADMDRF